MKELLFVFISAIAEKGKIMKDFIIYIIAVTINIAWYKWDKSHEYGTKSEQWDDAWANTNSRAFIRAMASFLAVLILCGGPLTLAH